MTTAVKTSPTYHVATFGCKLNQFDSAALARALDGLGFKRTEDALTAKVQLVNTCTVTGRADQEARQIIRRLKRNNPESFVVVTGCAARRDQEMFRSMDAVDLVMERDEGLPELAARFSLMADYHPGDVNCDVPLDFGDRTRAYLRVQEGCDLACSYCIIPKVRGRSRSVSTAMLKEQLGDLIDAGYKEIVLTGVNTGMWGWELDPPLRLEHLLDDLLSLPGDFRLRLNSLEPQTINGTLVDLVCDHPKMAPHLQIPLQAGTDDVLAAMHRRYTLSEYSQVIGELKQRNPGVCIGADVIVGFPGETPEQFQATLDYIQQEPIDYLHVFTYSSRPGTHAAKIKGHLSNAEKKQRNHRLTELGLDKGQAFRSNQLDTARTVLTLEEWDEQGRIRVLADNFIAGWMEQADHIQANTFVKATLQETRRDRFSLFTPVS